MLKREWRLENGAERGLGEKEKISANKKYGTYCVCAFIHCHTQRHQAQMKSVSFPKTTSTYRPDDKIQWRRRQQRQHLIQFDSFPQIFIASIWMWIFHFCLPSFGGVFSIHLTNSLTTNSWQRNILKYRSHLLVFAGKIRICKFDACRHLPFIVVCNVYCDCDSGIQYAHAHTHTQKPYLKITSEYHKIPIKK